MHILGYEKMQFMHIFGHYNAYFIKKHKQILLVSCFIGRIYQSF